MLSLSTIKTRLGHPLLLSSKLAKPSHIKHFHFQPQRTTTNNDAMDLALRNMGLEPVLIDVIHDILSEEGGDGDKSQPAPSRAYLRDAKAMAATPADVKELPNAYMFVIDMPGLKADQIKVHVEDDNVLVVSGERKREKERDQGIRYIRMERRLGKYLKRFTLPDDAETEKISATYQHGVLTVTVEKKPPPEPQEPKTVEVQVV